MREQSRARYPGDAGYLERGGARIWYEVYGTGSPDILLLPTRALAQSRRQ